MSIPTLLLLAAGLPVTLADTVVEARPGDSLVLRDFEGMVTVVGWDRSEVWAVSEDGEPGAVRIVRRGSSLEIGRSEGNRRSGEEIEIRVPPWIHLDFQGRELEADIVGVSGDVRVRTMEGDLTFRDLNGEVMAYTADGEIAARGMAGSASFQTGDGDIELVSCTASLDLETVNGDLDLRQITALRIQARTTEGDVDLSGSFATGGEYGFYSHGGDVTLRLLDPVDLEAKIMTYEGELESDFPVRAAGYRSGEPLEFTIGSGAAALTVESFAGEVKLIRARGPGDPGPPQ